MAAGRGRRSLAHGCRGAQRLARDALSGAVQGYPLAREQNSRGARRALAFFSADDKCADVGAAGVTRTVCVYVQDSVRRRGGPRGLVGACLRSRAVLSVESVQSDVRWDEETDGHVEGPCVFIPIMPLR